MGLSSLVLYHGSCRKMADIVLTTLNAKYIHASFGLRYLHANMPPGLRNRTVIREFDINQRPVDVVERILSDRPTIVGFGVYIWNTEPTLKIVQDLKRLCPSLVVVVGGPEVSYETEQQELCRLADYVIRGEADLAFGQLCDKLTNGRRPLMRVIDAELPEFQPAASADSARGSDNESFANSFISMPYDLYTDEDLSHRVLYVEASRGCPFKCEFCLSSLDVPVRNVPLQAFLSHMQKLMDRGARQFKFVDRTFNLNLKISQSILQFFLDRYTPGLFVHFEMIPDRLPEGLRQIIARFPEGALQFEVGIQTFNPEVEKLISRRQDHQRLKENLSWLRDHTGVHVHADLIVGLPGEDLESFARGFDQLYALGPQEIQVGMLKRLRGTPICRHDESWGMIYSPHPPYEILQTRLISFEQMQRMRRFARYWDLVANSGKFVHTCGLLLSDAHDKVDGQTLQGPFNRFLAFSDWLYARTGQRTHGIAQHVLAEALEQYLVDQRQMNKLLVQEVLKKDQNPRRRGDVPRRQAQHLSFS